jgi:hypothetical protein
MNLGNPDTRRGLRAVVEAIISLVAIALVAWLIHLLDGNAGPLERIAMALIALTALGTSGYVMENVTRAFKFAAGADGIKVEAGAEQAAQIVADAAQGQADAIKETRP